MKIAIIGSGPTGIYTLKGLIAEATPLSITIFEAGSEPGRGTPYLPHINDRAMLANIASFELPPINETLVAWLRRQADEVLERFGVARQTIDEREFYPRVLIGEYLHAQFQALLNAGKARGHSIDVKPLHRITDIRLQPKDIALTAEHADGGETEFVFDHVVMATGHNWPDNTEVKPGYFVSPWPSARLKSIGAGRVGILGTSLSAIDAVVSVTTAHGAFLLDDTGTLQFHASPDSEDLTLTMMSRKGLLPEADFYFEFPFWPLQFCNQQQVDTLVEHGTVSLLDAVFELFRQELLSCDPEYAAQIGLSLLTVETFADAYFAARREADPFVWAAANLAETQYNRARQHTVAWRYAILRMHEVVGRAVRHFNQDDLRRFNRHFKAVFIDDYATVPHQSIQRLLALHRAGRLEVLSLGARYSVETDGLESGAQVGFGQETRTFDAFIDATGQPSKSASDLPFPSLVASQFVKKAATAAVDQSFGDEAQDVMLRTGGIDVDDAFRPNVVGAVSNRLYCVAIPFLLHKMPFVQGIPNASEMGSIVSNAIRADLPGEVDGTAQRALLVEAAT